MLLTAERRAKRKGLSNPASPIQYQRQHRFASKHSFEHIGRPEMNILINVVLAVDMLVALLMTFVILMQRPKSEGLGAAFGGGVTENIFGAQTTNVLVKFTGWLAGIFFVLTFALGVLYAQHSSSDSALHKELMGMPTPAATATASPGPVSGSPAATTTSSAAASPAANIFSGCDRKTFGCDSERRPVSLRCTKRIAVESR